MSMWTGRSIWDEMRRMRALHDEIERVWGGSEAPRPGGFPPLNIWTNNEGAVVTAELPGVEPGSLEVSALQNTLTVKGERRLAEPKEGQSWHRRERQGGRFARTIQLPFVIDPDDVKATYRDGVFEAQLKRPEADKPKQIAVTAS